MWCHMGQSHDTLHHTKISCPNLRNRCGSDGSCTSMLKSFFYMFVFFFLSTFFVVFSGGRPEGSKRNLNFQSARCISLNTFKVKNFFSLLQSPRFVDPLHLSAMACPALPLFPLAIGEAERGAPDSLQRIWDMFERVSFVCHRLGS